ncbi:MAG: START domain-containing protein [Bacteroidota bacterium]
MKKILFLGSLFLLGALGATAQGPWQFIEETDGVKVYFREAASGPIKELKLELTVDAKLSTIMAVLNDVKAYEDWVFKCQEARVVKQVSDTEMYYYNEMDFPWPLSNRDLIAHSTIHQDPITREIKTQSKSAHYMEPNRDGVVRMTTIDVSWNITPLQNGKSHIIYTLKSDPGGSIPSWAVNFALDNGPIRSMRKFMEMLKMDKYRNQQIAFIQD